MYIQILTFEGMYKCRAEKHKSMADKRCQSDNVTHVKVKSATNGTNKKK